MSCSRARCCPVAVVSVVAAFAMVVNCSAVDGDATRNSGVAKAEGAGKWFGGLFRGTSGAVEKAAIPGDIHNVLKYAILTQI